MQRTDSLEKDPDAWKDWRQEEKGNDRGWDSWMASLTLWTCIWASSRGWWRTGNPNVLQSMGSQRIGHNWANELNWTSHWKQKPAKTSVGTPVVVKRRYPRSQGSPETMFKVQVQWKWKVKVKSLSHVRLFASPWTVAHQAPPSMEFSRQEYWSGLPFPPQENYLGYGQVGTVRNLSDLQSRSPGLRR